ncbi:MAG: DUF3536 domain-containing protein, partial [Gemmatimonas sp.]
DAKLTNAATMVATHPPSLEARLVSPSSWSCAHGVERWRSNCGCRIGQDTPPAQEWRAPLRAALTSLARESDVVFAREGSAIFATDPWRVRDAYGAVVGSDGAALDAFVVSAVPEGADHATHMRAHELLELQRASMRMFTSCAWFFDDVNRIETRQVLRYAARVLELSGDADALTPDFLRGLEAARSPVAGGVSARELFLRDLSSRESAEFSVAAGAMALAAAGLPCTRIAAYDVRVAPMAADRAYEVTLTHRRTRSEATVGGTVSGRASAVGITVNASGGQPQHARTLAIHELPERVATSLLRQHALDDGALSG